MLPNMFSARLVKARPDSRSGHVVGDQTDGKSCHQVEIWLACDILTVLLLDSHLRVPFVPLRHFHVAAALADRLDAAHSSAGSSSFDPALLALKEIGCGPTPLVDSAGHLSREPEPDPDPEPLRDVDALLENAAQKSAKRAIRNAMRRHTLDAAAVAAMSETDLQMLCAETVEHAKEGFRIRAALIDVRNPADPFRFAVIQTLIEDMVRARYAAMPTDSALRDVARAKVTGKQVEDVAQQQPARAAVVTVVHDGKANTARTPTVSASIDPAQTALDRDSASLDSGDHVPQEPGPGPDVDSLLEAAAKRTASRAIRVVLRRHVLDAAAIAAMSEQDLQALCAETTDCAMEKFKTRVAFLGVGESLDPPRLAANQRFVETKVRARYGAMRSDSALCVVAKGVEEHDEGQDPRAMRGTATAGMNDHGKVGSSRPAALASSTDPVVLAPKKLSRSPTTSAAFWDSVSRTPVLESDMDDVLGKVARRSVTSGIRTAMRSRGLNSAPVTVMSERDLRVLCSETTELAKNVFGTRIALRGICDSLDSSRLAAIQTFIKNLVVAKYASTWSGSSRRTMSKEVAQQVETLAQQATQGISVTNLKGDPIDMTRVVSKASETALRMLMQHAAICRYAELAADTPDLLWHSSRCMELVNEEFSRMMAIAKGMHPVATDADDSLSMDAGSSSSSPMTHCSRLELPRDATVAAPDFGTAERAIQHVFDARRYSVTSPPSLDDQARADLYTDVHHRALLDFDERIAKMGIVTKMLRRRAAKNYLLQRARVLEQVSALMTPLFGPLPDSESAASTSSAITHTSDSHATTAPTVLDRSGRSGLSTSNQAEVHTDRPDALARRAVSKVDWTLVARAANSVAQETASSVFRTKGMHIFAPPRLTSAEVNALESEMLSLALLRFDERMSETRVHVSLLGRAAEDQFREHREIVKRVISSKLRNVFGAPFGGGSNWVARDSRPPTDTARVVADLSAHATPVAVLPLTNSAGPDADAAAATVHDGVATRSMHDMDERGTQQPRAVPLVSPVDPGTLASAVLVSKSMSDLGPLRQPHEQPASALALQPGNPDGAPLDCGSSSADSTSTTSKDATSAAANPTPNKDAIPTASEAGALVQSGSQFPDAVVVAADPMDVRAAAPEPAVLSKAARRAARIAERKAAKAALPAAHDSAELVKAEREPETAAERDARLKAERKASKHAWSAARNAGACEAAVQGPTAAADAAMTAVSDATEESTVAERDAAVPQVDLFSNGRAAVLTPLLSALPLDPSSMAAPTDPKFPFMSVLGKPSKFWYEFMPSDVHVGANDLIPSSVVLYLAAKVPGNNGGVKHPAIFEWVHMVLRASPNLTGPDWAQLRAAPNERLAKVNAIIFKYRNELDVYKNHILIMLRAWSIPKGELPRPSRHWLRTNALEFKYARALAGDIMDIYMTLDETQQENLRRVVVQMLILIGHASKAAKVLGDDHATARKLIPWLLALGEVEPIMWCTVYLALRNEPARKPIRSRAASQMAMALARTGMPKLAIELYEKYGVVGEKRVELTILMANAIMTSLSHLARENRNMLLEMVRWYHDIVQNHQLRPNWFMFNTLIFAHLTANDARGALHFFYERHRTHVGPVDFDSAAATAVLSSGGDASDPVELERMPSYISTAARLWRPSATAQEYVRNDRVAGAVLRAVATRATLEQTLQLYQMLRTHGYAVDERMVEAMADAYVHDRRLQTRIVEGTSMFTDVMFANLLLIMVVMGGSVLKDWREGAAAGADDTDAVAAVVFANREEDAAVAADAAAGSAQDV
ncbi:hypothetical protein AMAG_00260 [Allomyces macrogynus ATCC 38327]|uniref:Uncharacterized protein n=1 Tax=Allomyces macrogynus (strain ATCC 38327) TaxID=578462 RepID=A0A0L0RVC6_ALLM3|nr:hypothetical protein AMAG_00260 [Allomyces macrogynus ATCC 38327]|eukprot:KNE54268.1 hypothetical protein AMAG_00260 [Allomyces macrogynus ATCC 38327]